MSNSGLLGLLGSIGSNNAGLGFGDVFGLGSASQMMGDGSQCGCFPGGGYNPNPVSYNPLSTAGTLSDIKYMEQTIKGVFGGCAGYPGGQPQAPVNGGCGCSGGGGAFPVSYPGGVSGGPWSPNPGAGNNPAQPACGLPNQPSDSVYKDPNTGILTITTGDGTQYTFGQDKYGANKFDPDHTITVQHADGSKVVEYGGPNEFAPGQTQSQLWANPTAQDRQIYSVDAKGRPTSVIDMQLTPQNGDTMDPNSPNFNWADKSATILDPETNKKFVVKFSHDGDPELISETTTPTLERCSANPYPIDGRLINDDNASDFGPDANGNSVLTPATDYTQAQPVVYDAASVSSRQNPANPDATWMHGKAEYLLKIAVGITPSYQDMQKYGVPDQRPTVADVTPVLVQADNVNKATVGV